MADRRVFAALLAFSWSLACEDEGPPARWQIGLAVEETEGAFLSVWGRDRGEVYAVGGNPSHGAMRRFDGGAWVEEALPDGMPLVNWVAGLEGDGGALLWLAGNEGQLARRGPAGEWARMSLTSTSALWGVWAAADDDAWAVGGDIPGDGPVLARWDGASWTELELPAADREFDALFKVWGHARDRVWAVGHRGVVFHFDGAAWSQQLAGTTSDLISLWGTPDGGLVAVGGRSNGVIARYDAATATWTSQTIGELPGLNGVWVDAAGEAFVVGMDGVVLTIEPGGFTWRELDRSARPDTLHGAFGLPDGARFGVGGDLLFNPPWTGVIVQFLP